MSMSAREFEQWYAENAFDYERNPIGSHDCGLMRKAWNASRAALLSSVEDGEGIVRELDEAILAAKEELYSDPYVELAERCRARITLDAQEKAALQATLDEVSAAIGDVRYMDPPDGGDVPIAEQVRRMRAELASVKAERDSLGTQLEQIAHERTP